MMYIFQGARTYHFSSLWTKRVRFVSFSNYSILSDTFSTKVIPVIIFSFISRFAVVRSRSSCGRTGEITNMFGKQCAI